MSRALVELAGPTVAEVLRRDSVVVLPTGAVEHHGPHLPLVTDALVAEAVATAAVDRAAAAGTDAWVLPTLTYTKSDEHAWAPGTMWLTAETLLSTVVDLGRALAATPARRLVFLNGHGGNVAMLQVACRELRRRFGFQTFLLAATVKPAPGEGPDELGMGIHGGHGETSLVLHLRPDLVDLTKAYRNVPEHIVGFRHIGFHSKSVSFGWLSDDFGPGGFVGDPTAASAAAGARLFEASVARAAEALAEIAVFDPARAPHPAEA